MNRSYRLGLLIVTYTILASLVLVLVGEVTAARRPPARIGQDLGGDTYPLGSYQLTERSGRAVTDADLAGDVWVAAFVFTRCPSSCPRITARMKGMQAQVLGAGAKLVSISVDPKYDTPEVLAKYATAWQADPTGWFFLTGDRDSVYDLILHRFHLGVSEAPEDDQKRGAEAIAHSDRLALVDHGNRVVGVYDSDDPEAIRELLTRVRRLASWARPLPAVNAGLNGWVKSHIACMISSTVVSAVFLGCYLAYHYKVGSVAFPGTGAIRVAYRTILLSHVVLAAGGVVPLVTLTLIRAIRRQWDRHANIARVTFPVWFYVSVTGVVIYAMLYQMPIRTY